jgi:hypothetical protein
MKRIVKLASAIASNANYGYIFKRHGEFIDYVAKKKAESLAKLYRSLRGSYTLHHRPEGSKAFSDAMKVYRDEMSDLARLGKHLERKGYLDRDVMSTKGAGELLDSAQNQHLVHAPNAPFQTSREATAFRRASDLGAALHKYNPNRSYVSFAERYGRQ